MSRVVEASRSDVLTGHSRRSRRIAGCLVAVAIAGTMTGAIAQDRKTESVKAVGDTVEMILGNLPSPTSSAYKRLRAAAGGSMGQMLDMTKAEVWLVPSARVQRVTAEAERSGVVVTKLDEKSNHLLAPMAANAAMLPKQSEMMATAMKSSSVMGVGMMSAQPASMVEYALTKGANNTAAKGDTASTIVLAVDAKTSIKIKRQSLRSGSNGHIWRGVTVDTNEPATLMWSADGRITGSVTHKGMMYAIRHMGAGTTAIVAMDADKMPTEHAPMTPMKRDDPKLATDPLFMTGDGGAMRPRQGPMPTMPAPAPAATAGQAASLAKDAVTPMVAAERPIEITLMVAFTKKAARQYADIGLDLIALAVEDTNQSFRNSGIGHLSVRLVHTHETDYDETGAVHFDHVWRMADKGDGFMEEIPKLRDQKQADIVVLVVDDPSGCGLATRVAADAEEAYAVVHHECAATSYTLAHEIGHIIGARHDHSLDQSSGPFPFGHGFVNGTTWRTMMSYKSSCKGCPRLPIWSNPDIKIQGVAAGTEKSNNARVLREQAERVAGFRSTRPSP